MFSPNPLVNPASFSSSSVHCFHAFQQELFESKLNHLNTKVTTALHQCMLVCAHMRKTVPVLHYTMEMYGGVDV
jgi:hypothetical protein